MFSKWRRSSSHRGVIQRRLFGCSHANSGIWQERSLNLVSYNLGDGNWGRALSSRGLLMMSLSVSSSASSSCYRRGRSQGLCLVRSPGRFEAIVEVVVNVTVGFIVECFQGTSCSRSSSSELSWSVHSWYASWVLLPRTSAKMSRIRI